MTDPTGRIGFLTGHGAEPARTIPMKRMPPLLKKQECADRGLGIAPKFPIGRSTVSSDPTQPAVHTNPKRQRGYFPFCRKDLRQPLTDASS